MLARVTAVLLAASLAACSSSTPPAGGDASAEPTVSTSSSAPEKADEAPVAAPLPLNADGLLGGDAAGLTFDDGEPGKVSVVQTGTPDSDSGTVPVVFRNNTDAAVSHVDISGTARDAAGGLLATGSSQGTTPAQIPAGGVGLAYVYFEPASTVLPADTVFEFTFETTEADTSSYNTADLKVVEANRVGTAIVGSATNATGATVTGPYSADVYCFDAGRLTTSTRSFANEDDDLAADALATFTVDLFDAPCATYLVGVTGYFA